MHQKGYLQIYLRRWIVYHCGVSRHSSCQLYCCPTWKIWLCTYGKGSQKEKMSTFPCRATKTPFRKILYWQKNRAKQFIFPSVWSWWFFALWYGATIPLQDHVLLNSKRPIYLKLDRLQYQDQWPRYYYRIQYALPPMLGYPGNRVF